MQLLLQSQILIHLKTLNDMKGKYDLILNSLEDLLSSTEARLLYATNKNQKRKIEIYKKDIETIKIKIEIIKNHNTF